MKVWTTGNVLNQSSPLLPNCLARLAILRSSTLSFLFLPPFVASRAFPPSMLIVACECVCVCLNPFVPSPSCPACLTKCEPVGRNEPTCRKTPSNNFWRDGHATPPSVLNPFLCAFLSRNPRQADTLTLTQSHCEFIYDTALRSRSLSCDWQTPPPRPRSMDLGPVSVSSSEYQGVTPQEKLLVPYTTNRWCIVPCVLSVPCVRLPRIEETIHRLTIHGTKRQHEHTRTAR